MEALIYITAKGGETVKKEVSHYITHLMEIKTALSGNDLKKSFELKPGPEFKKILAGLLDARLEGIVKTREEEMKWVKRRNKK